LDLLAPEKSEELPKALERADAIIHNAALIPGGSRDGVIPEGRFVETNAMGTHKLLRLVAGAGSGKRFIFISSHSILAEVGDELSEDSPFHPGDEYLASKIMAETLCRQFHLQGRINLSILRIRAPYGYSGNNSAVIPRFLSLVRASKDITLWGTGNRQQAFTFVEDIGLACRLCLDKVDADTFNLSGGAPVTMLELATRVLGMFPQSSSRIVYSGKEDPQEGRKIPATGRKAERVLGFAPRFTLAQGLESVVRSHAEAGPGFFLPEADATSGGSP
jgi:nucleoside-diphosphate-sugar epimerase